jgi:hypothetical protein
MKILILFTFLFIACNAGTETANKKSRMFSQPIGKRFVSAKSNYTHQIVKLATNTYGYIIYYNHVVLIKQSSVPGKPGKKGFKRETDARKVSELVITKLSKGEFPPLVSVQEMDEILYSQQ